MQVKDDAGTQLYPRSVSLDTNLIDRNRDALGASSYNCIMTQSYDGSGAALLLLARMKAGLSQRELAENAGVPTTMISAYERGLREPSLPTLQRLLAAAGFELRMQLAPVDPHDQVLEALEARRSPKERKRRDREMEQWRKARPA